MESYALFHHARGRNIPSGEREGTVMSTLGQI
jgi:hypothetical protein